MQTPYTTFLRLSCFGVWIALLVLAVSSSSTAPAQAPAAPLPDVHQLMRAVMDHQKQLELVRENFHYLPRSSQRSRWMPPAR